MYWKFSSSNILTDWNKCFQNLFGHAWTRCCKKVPNSKCFRQTQMKKMFSHCKLLWISSEELKMFLIISASINGILQCGLGSQKLYCFLVKTALMRTHFRAFTDLWIVIIINIPKGLWKACIYDNTHLATKVCVFIMVELMYILYNLIFHWLKYFLEHHQSFHPILPAGSLSSCLSVTFNCAL